MCDHRRVLLMCVCVYLFFTSIHFIIFTYINNNRIDIDIRLIFGAIISVRGVHGILVLLVIFAFF